MTIEEKVQDILFTMFQKIVIDYNKNQDRFTGIISLPNKTINQATQTLLALIKPMSMERLIDIIVDFMRINKDPDKGFTGELKSVGWSDINNLADAILAEWGKE